MSTKNEQELQQFYAKMAGLSYVTFTVAGFINNFFLNGSLSDLSNAPLTSIFENEMHYRLGILAETIMFLGVTMASLSYYIVLKPVNKQLSMTALCFRLVEIIIGSLVVVLSMAILAISSKASLIEIMGIEQIRELASVISSFMMPAFEYSWIFMGFAGIITFYLFYQSRYIPRAWSVWGMFTYTTLILYPVAKILVPDLPREVMFVMFPGAFFELGVGIWLLAKGINIPIDGGENIS